MAKLYFLLVISGQIGGTWGPLPYDMAECQSRKVQRDADLDRAVREGKWVAAQPRSEWMTACVERTSRPELGERP